MKGRYHKLDGWRGYPIPGPAIIGASFTGNDGPAPLEDVQSEIVGFRLWLRTHGIRSRTKFGESSNVFCAKLWVVVKLDDFRRAAQLALDYLGSPNLVYLHSADQEEVLK